MGNFQQAVGRRSVQPRLVSKLNNLLPDGLQVDKPPVARGQSAGEFG
jgi:hypothetical protein